MTESDRLRAVYERLIAIFREEEVELAVSEGWEGDIDVELRSTRPHGPGLSVSIDAHELRNPGPVRTSN
jgi:hypothetical protein